MSTIASPRPSISTSSRRTSTSTDTAAQSQVDRGSLRRNRAALRDYYGLKAADSPDPAATPPIPSFESERESELDKPDFNPASYVSTLLAKESIDGVLKVEAGLVSEIRSLDGEKKALVYDNYSKLIAATDTIKNMRERMDPLTPTTSTLTPAIGHIAETAAGLSRELRKAHGESALDGKVQKQQRDQKATVRWILDAPARLERLVQDGDSEEADKQWAQINGLLRKWEGVKGVSEVRQGCMAAMESPDAP
jgi:vacuolar protein sorting-associated protein 51